MRSEAASWATYISPPTGTVRSGEIQMIQFPQGAGRGPDGVASRNGLVEMACNPAARAITMRNPIVPTSSGRVMPTANAAISFTPAFPGTF